MSPVALSLSILRSHDGSPAALGIVLGVASGATLTALVGSGALAGRVSPVRLAVVCNYLAGAAQASLGIMLVLHSFTVAGASALQLISGAALGTYFPTLLGLTASTVGPSTLQRANASLSLVRSAAGMIGPALAGVAVVTIGGGWVIVLDGGTFLAAAAILGRMGVHPQPTSKEPGAAPAPSALAGLFDGLVLVRSRLWIWSTLLVFCVAQLASAVFLVLGPTVVLTEGRSAGKWAALISFVACGQIVGDLFTIRFRPSRPLLAGRVFGLLGVPALIALGVGAPYALLALSCSLRGFASVGSDTIWFTLLQRELREPQLSQVSAWDWLVSLVMQPVGYFAAGFVAAGVGARTTLIALASLYLLVNVSSLSSRSVRQLRSPEMSVRQ